MNDKELKNLSKFLSFILRHKPEHIGLQLSADGWANVKELVEKTNTTGTPLSEETLQIIVDTNGKKRFAYNEDKTFIRASQGHSINIDLQLTASLPPEILFHGTAAANEREILEKGIEKRARQFVHLSSQISTAREVGSRHGKPIVFEVNCKQMHTDENLFYLSDNNVWLTEFVSPIYIKKLE